jgi:hypothetical protein
MWYELQMTLVMHTRTHTAIGLKVNLDTVGIHYLYYQVYASLRDRSLIVEFNFLPSTSYQRRITSQSTHGLLGPGLICENDSGRRVAAGQDQE